MGSLPNDIVSNPKNNGYIMPIITKSSWNISNDVVNVYNEPNFRGVKVQ